MTLDPEFRRSSLRCCVQRGDGSLMSPPSEDVARIMFAVDRVLPADDGQLLQLFTDCVLDYAMFTLCEHGRVATWNRGAERLFGYAAHEIKGQPFECLSPADPASQQEAAQELLLAGQRGSFEIEGWRLRKDGDQIGVYTVVTAFRDGDQKLRGYAVVTRDVTEQRRSLQEIQDQKRRLRSILDTAVDAVFTIDEHGIIESVNPAGERIFGYQADEIIGRNVNLLMPEPFASEHTGYIQRYLRTGNAKIIGIGREVQGKRKDGSIFPADLAVSTFRDGKQLFTGILRDISERKTMEAEVLQIAEAEQRRIGQELHDDAQQQLSALAMIARNAADSLTPFLAGIPELSVVQTKVERVVKGLRDANQSLREVARGLVPLQIEAHGLRSALTKLAEQIREAHDVACRCSVEDGLDIDDRGMETHLYRIAQEAVNNSLRHGSARQIEIRLRAADGTMLLEIADDGIGIAASDEKRGRGLQIMAYRAGLIGAVFTVRRSDSGGTIVSCAWPVR